ncbi:MAG: hypothetical protein M3Y87_02075 [Myxococcota bacterium]|nr:hypothetical protein [Myxococcota bacterium]
MAIEVSEDLIRAVTTKDKALSDGRTLVKKGAFKSIFRTGDNSLLWGQCQGSGSKPYELSIDLAGDTPTIRCSCPVKPPPCKHTLGLLVCFLEQATKFQEGEPPAELLEKRAKNVGRAEKRAESAAKPSEANLGAQKKKAEAQRAAIDDLLEPLLLDAVKSGLGTIDAKRASRLVEQARQLHDAYLPGAAERLRRIAALAKSRSSDDGDDDVYYQLREPGDELPDELRHRLIARHVTRLWAMVRKGRKYLDDKLEEGESQGDADAVVEELLGRVWKLDELKHGGHAKQSLQLFELAYERFDDHVREERIEQSWLLDLEEGSIYVDRTFRPLDRLDKMKEGESFEKPLLLSEAAVYPGFVNRRVRWELSARKSRNVELTDFERIHARALPSLDVAVAKLKEQIKNPLAPDEAVVLVRASEVRKVEGGLALVDAKGARLSLRDSPLARYRALGNFEMAVGAAIDESGALEQPASVLLRLYVGLADEAIHAQPLSLVVGTRHVRVGM